MCRKSHVRLSIYLMFFLLIIWSRKKLACIYAIMTQYSRNYAHLFLRNDWNYNVILINLESPWIARGFDISILRGRKSTALRDWFSSNYHMFLAIHHPTSRGNHAWETDDLLRENVLYWIWFEGRCDVWLKKSHRGESRIKKLSPILSAMRPTLV